MFTPVPLPPVPGRLIAASEPNFDRLALWTDTGFHILKLTRTRGSYKLWETLPTDRARDRFNPKFGSVIWRRILYPMHGACGPGGTIVGLPTETASAAGLTLERAGDTLRIKDVSGAVRQVIDGCGAKAKWSAAGFAGYEGRTLFVIHPGGVRVFRYTGSPEGGGAVWQRAADPGQRQALLRAVIENPDDDTPRLVYADWLEEHGDPDRAAYIRVQCRIAERQQAADFTFPDPDLERNMTLETANEARWRGELPALPGVSYNFTGGTRGFPRIDVRNPATLVRHAARLLAATPVEAVFPTSLPPAGLARFLKTDLPDRVSHLSTYSLPAGSGALLADWLTSPRAARLRRVRLDSVPEEWDEVLRAVGMSRYLTRLERLEADGWRDPAPPDEGVVLAVARSPHLPRLRYVSYGFWNEYPKKTKAELRKRFPGIDLR